MSEKMLTKEDALRAYASMMNTLDASHIEPLLADDFHYASQWVFAEIKSQQEYLDYIRPKLEAVKASGKHVWAEMAKLEREIPGPCVVLAQDERDNLISLVLAVIKDGKISRLDMCGAPSPHDAIRSGIYPS
jgi:hypothetical protein